MPLARGITAILLKEFTQARADHHHHHHLTIIIVCHTNFIVIVIDPSAQILLFLPTIIIIVLIIIITFADTVSAEVLATPVARAEPPHLLSSSC